MTDDAGTGDLAAFDRHRRLLFTVAYQMLGSVADAEDTVQDAWLRWSAADRGEVIDARPYLVQITTRLALDRMDSARARRESYVGPWLPEPLLTGGATVASAPQAPEPEDAAELGEQVSLALLVVLETLSPAERAVFVLREVFGMSVTEVARALNRSEAAVRQMAHRARQHVQARQPRFDADQRSQRQVTERFFAAVAGGDVEALLAALAPDVVLISDGGGKAKAARRPITGADKVARFLVGIAEQGADIPDLRVEVAEVNGLPALVGWVGAEPFGSISLTVSEGRIEQVLIVVNPDKLAGLSVTGSGSDLGSGG
jgi:RNA polymerase sigma-70 factor (TIGR02957 family)